MKTIHKVFLLDFYRQLVRRLLSDDLACSFSFRIVPALFVAFVRYLVYKTEGSENGVVIMETGQMGAHLPRPSVLLLRL